MTKIRVRDGEMRRSRGIVPAAGLVAILAFVIAGCSGAGGGSASAEDYPSEDMRIMVPADPGGGYDQTGRSVQRALTEGGVTDQNVEVYNVPGASGTSGLTEFVSSNAGNPHEFMIMGKILVGAVEQTDAPVDLSETTAIARLTSEYDAIVVPTDSEYQDLGQLMEDFEADPGSISWGGGSIGGVDQILVGELANEVGVDPADINYIPYSGGGELTPAILSGDVTVGVSGLAEFESLIQNDQVRVLAVSSEEPIEGVDAPTITEAGYDVTVANWRGIVAPPDLSEEQTQAVISMMDEMHETEEWQQALESNNWGDYYLTGQEFSEYIQQEQEDISQTLQDLGVVE